MPLSKRAVTKLNTALREADSEGFKMVVAAFNDVIGEITFMSSASNDPDVVGQLALEALNCMAGQTVPKVTLEN